MALHSEDSYVVSNSVILFIPLRVGVISSIGAVMEKLRSACVLD